MKLKSLIITLATTSLALGTVAVASAQSDDTAPSAPVEFTGSLAFGDCPGPLTTEIIPGKVEYRGARYCLPGVVKPFSDPRLQGTYYIWPYHDEHIDGPTIWASGFTITNDEGAWRGMPAVSLETSPSETHVLIGDGAYQGLTAIATVTFSDTGSGWDWQGWIIEGEVPPMPEPPAVSD